MSSLVVHGRDGTPTAEDDWLASPPMMSGSMEDDDNPDRRGRIEGDGLFGGEKKKRKCEECE